MCATEGCINWTPQLSGIGTIVSATPHTSVIPELPSRLSDPLSDAPRTKHVLWAGVQAAQSPSGLMHPQPPEGETASKRARTPKSDPRGMQAHFH